MALSKYRCGNIEILNRCERNLSWNVPAVDILKYQRIFSAGNKAVVPKVCNCLLDKQRSIKFREGHFTSTFANDVLNFQLSVNMWRRVTAKKDKNLFCFTQITNVLVEG